MDRIDIDKANKSTLKAIFQELGPELRGDTKPKEFRRSQRLILEELDMHENDWQRLVKGTFGIKGYRSRIHRLLKSRNLTAFKRKDRSIFLMLGNPRLTTILATWGKNNTADTRFYIYHYTATQRPELDDGYTPEVKVRQALLAINYQQKECSLFFFTSPEKRQTELNRKLDFFTSQDLLEDLKENTDEWVVARYHGDLQTVGSQFYLSFNQRVANNRKTGEPESSHHRGLVVFRVPNMGARLRREEVGNFAAIGPSSGICVLKECRVDQIFKRIAIPNIDRGVGHLLVGTSYSYANHRDFYKLSSHENILEKLTDYVGSYEGISLVSRYGKEALSIASFIIDIDGRIAFSSVQNQEMSGYIFQISSFRGEHANYKLDKKAVVLCCCIDYSHEFDHHRMFMTVQFEDNSAVATPYFEPFAIGAYTGLFKDDDYPQSGRLILRKLAPGEEIAIRNIALDDKRLGEKTSLDRGKLLAYLTGFRDDIADRPFASNTSMMDRAIYPQLHYLGKRNCQYYFGDYLLYYPSSDGERVYQKYLKIGPEPTSVIWYDRHDGSSMECYLGSVAVIHKNLSIRFNEKTTHTFDRRRPKGETMDRMLVFMIGTVPEPPDEGVGLEGKIYRQDRNHDPVMSDAVIVPIQKLEDENSVQKHMKSFVVEEVNSDIPSANLIKKLFRKKA